MPDVLTLKTPHFDLSVWTKEIGSAQALLVRTHAARNAALPANPLRFNPALPIDEVVLPVGVPLPMQPVTELVLPVPLFLKTNSTSLNFFSAIWQTKPACLRLFTG